MEIVMCYPERQLARSGLRIGISKRIGPLPQQRLNKALCLAVGAWRVRPGADMPGLESAQQLGELL